MLRLNHSAMVAAGASLLAFGGLALLSRSRSSGGINVIFKAGIGAEYQSWAEHFLSGLAGPALFLLVAGALLTSRGRLILGVGAAVASAGTVAAALLLRGGEGAPLLQASVISSIAAPDVTSHVIWVTVVIIAVGVGGVKLWASVVKRPAPMLLHYIAIGSSALIYLISCYGWESSQAQLALHSGFQFGQFVCDSVGTAIWTGAMVLAARRGNRRIIDQGV